MIREPEPHVPDVFVIVGVLASAIFCIVVAITISIDVSARFGG